MNRFEKCYRHGPNMVIKTDGRKPILSMYERVVWFVFGGQRSFDPPMQASDGYFEIHEVRPPIWMRLRNYLP